MKSAQGMGRNEDEEGLAPHPPPSQPGLTVPLPLPMSGESLALNFHRSPGTSGEDVYCDLRSGRPGGLRFLDFSPCNLLFFFSY